MTEEPSVHDLMREALDLAERMARAEDELAAAQERWHILQRSHADALLAIQKALSRMPVVTGQRVRPDAATATPAPIPSISVENVGPLARLVLEIVNNDPAQVWESSALIDEVIKQFGHPLERNKISTTIYRLRKGGLLINNDGAIHSINREAWMAGISAMFSANASQGVMPNES